MRVESEHRRHGTPAHLAAYDVHQAQVIGHCAPHHRLNQIEIYCSVVQRKLLTPDDAPSLQQLAERLTAFENRYNQAAQPFDWKFNRDDLNQLLNRIAA